MKKSSVFAIMFFAVLGLIVGTTMTQAAENLTGTWTCEVNSSTGKSNSTFVLQQDGEKVTGTYKRGSAELKVTGKIKGSDFELTYNHSRLNITWKGKVEGDKISGSFDMGPAGSGSFTGEKSVEKK